MSLTSTSLLTTRMAPVSEQVQRLIDIGVPDAAGISAEELRDHTARLRGDADSILAIHPRLATASALAPLLSRAGRPGFVVADFTDLDRFEAIEGLALPEHPLYLLRHLDRGDDLANRAPDEVLPELRARGRRPLTIGEGISWLLQQPELLQPNHCFMTIGSRLRTDAGVDARTPAIWISAGTGRDGRARRGAPKVGWCRAGGRHTGLGFASVAV